MTSPFSTLLAAMGVYALVMTAANLSIAHFGPWVSPINAFVLIGLDLALRDWLHTRLNKGQMGALILSSGALTYLLNPSAGMIAVASSTAFVAASITDWFVFSKLRGTWLYRSNGSNVVGAAIDSLIFPTLAFGVLMPHIVLLQFAAKISGGAVWSFVLHKLRQRVPL